MSTNDFPGERTLVFCWGDVFESDDAYLAIRPALIDPLQTQQPPTVIEFAGTAAFLREPSELRLRFEGHSELPGAAVVPVRLEISLFNYATNQYDELCSGLLLDLPDSEIQIVVDSHAAEYMHPSSGDVKALISFKSQSFRQFSFAEGWMDHVVWALSP